MTWGILSWPGMMQWLPVSNPSSPLFCDFIYWQSPEMSEPYFAVVVSVPAEHFPDDDALCLTAGKFVCARLETFLLEKGHRIAEWVRGGCDEDWGVYFETQRGSDTFEYSICFFPTLSHTPQTHMMIQYHPKTPFLRRLFATPHRLDANHYMHETMREFGQTFESSRMFTQPQFDKEY